MAETQQCILQALNDPFARIRQGAVQIKKNVYHSWLSRNQNMSEWINKELPDSIEINIAWQGKKWYLKIAPRIIDWKILVSRIQPL